MAIKVGITDSDASDGLFSAPPPAIQIYRS